MERKTTLFEYVYGDLVREITGGALRPGDTLPSMGELGKVTRVRGGAFGSVMTFASKGKASAPGQIDAETLSKMLNEN